MVLPTDMSATPGLFGSVWDKGRSYPTLFVSNIDVKILHGTNRESIFRCVLPVAERKACFRIGEGMVLRNWCVVPIGKS